MSDPTDPEAQYLGAAMKPFIPRHSGPEGAPMQPIPTLTIPAVAPTITVKPLVWHLSPVSTPIWRRYLAYHEGQPAYSIIEQPDRCFLTRDIVKANDTKHPTLAAAQSAAQAEWSQFVRAAITPFPRETASVPEAREQ